MRAVQARVATLADALRVVEELGAKTVVLDIEPLVAYWDSGQQSLDKGVASVLGEFAKVPGVAAVVFATNSARRPSASPEQPGIEVAYLASAHKPFRVGSYRDLPTPGVLIGDQVLTDGLLAWRLGYTFVQYAPERERVPGGPWLLAQAGRLARPLLFRQPGKGGTSSATGDLWPEVVRQAGTPGDG
jgi:predicted HAD superfamily phosphohydrolase YqeG